jgi:predicted nucleotidyltransferase
MTNLNLSQLTDRLKQWSAKAVNDYSARSIYLFGSLIHKEGQQFSRNSDIDLVVVMPQLDDALARHRWLESFSEHKEALEIQLMRLLGRLAAEPSASIVAVTDTELAFDIHKDGHRQFFTANTFRNLSTDANTTGIPGAGRASPDRCVAVALAFAQKIRNEYFAVSANGTSTLIAYEGPDPLPKQIMRAAAMAARAIGKTNGPGAEYDVQEGLDLLFNHLYTDRNRASALSELQDLVSVRRNARGQYRPVDPTHQLLLAELIFDLATSVGVNAVPPL